MNDRMTRVFAYLAVLDLPRLRMLYILASFVAARVLKTGLFG